MRMLPGTAVLVAAVLVAGTSPATAIPMPDTVIDYSAGKSTPDTAKILPSQQAIFYFTSTGPPSDGFQCQVDGGGFTACTSPKTYQLGYGSHIFEVRATAGGDADSTPALSQWIVRNVACEQATADYKDATSRFFKYHTQRGYKKEALQRARSNGNTAKVRRLKKKIKKLNGLIKQAKADMTAAQAQEDAVC